MRSRAASALLMILLVLNFAVPEPSDAQTAGTPLTAAPVPLPPEINPPGDIPDTQVFVAYRSSLGFSIKTPEGWARHTSSDGVSFTAKYDSVAVKVTAAPSAPTVATAKHDQAADLERQPIAARVSKIASVDLPAGPAVMIAYGSNSERNPVTGKAIRLENASYLIWHDGKLATLTLSAPFGADNADQWRLMARSFRWH